VIFKDALIITLSRDKQTNIKSLSSKNKPVFAYFLISLILSLISTYKGYLIVADYDESMLNMLLFYICATTLLTSISVFFGLIYIYIRKLIKKVNESTP
jgi:hypothetical protein